MIPPEEIRQKLDQIKGHLVWMPLEFLKDAPMAETGEFLLSLLPRNRAGDQCAI